MHALITAKDFDSGLKVLAKWSTVLDDFPDFHFASGLFYLNLVRSNPAQHLSALPQIERCYQRCLAIGETSAYKSVRGTGTFLAHYNLGIFYHVFDETTLAARSFENAAQYGYAPALQMLQTLNAPPELETATV